MLIQKAKSNVNPQNPQNIDAESETYRRALDRVLYSDMSPEAKLIALARLRGATTEEIHYSVLSHGSGVSND